MFFFFKQKTAYEMRISDWSSDVCSSDLHLQAANAAIRLVKEQAAAGNRPALAADLAQLNAVKARHSAEIALRCAAYLEEKLAKAATEVRRNAAREALEDYRRAVFPNYEVAINLYLQRFNAGFRLAGVAPVTARAGSSCTYNAVTNKI